MSILHSPGPGAALILGVGSGLGASLCRTLTAASYKVGAMGRSLTSESKLGAGLLESAPGLILLKGDVTSEADILSARQTIEEAHGPLALAFYNAAQLDFGDLETLTAQTFEQLWRVNCFGAMLAAKAILPGMAARDSGAMLFAGATASIMGGARAPAFASSKFALRGLVQSLSRYYAPKGVHIAHIILDGRIDHSEASRPFRTPEQDNMHPDDIAKTLLNIATQPKSAWTQELDLRPFAETF
ncbi:MAG: SDR family NAD(P)-dependent oxidoreductase [Parvularculaceae bacterium]